MVIVNLGGKKKPHTQGKKKSLDASTKMHSPFPMGLSASWYGADTALLQRQERGPMGGLEEEAEMGMLEYGVRVGR